MTAAVIPNEPVEFTIGGQSISARGYVVDVKTYFCELESRREAYYLAAVLNAPIIDKMIKPMQSRGLFGPRDIHKKVLDLPIPEFDAKDPSHNHLAKLGRECGTKVETWLAKGAAGSLKGIGRLRASVRAMLRGELEEIDSLVKKML